MIHFFCEDTTFDLSLLTNATSWLDRVARLEHQSIHVVNYVLCSDEYLLTINQQYLQHNYYTDVITFDQRDDFLSSSVEGDIFISVDRVRENASSLHVSSLHELLRVIVHGLLHLLGHSDSTDELKQRMRCLENEYLDLYSTSFELL